MKVLAIETSTMLGGAAIMDSEAGLIAEVRTNVRATLSERLMRCVDFALTQSGLSLTDIDALAVATGPGSFTGLRIGLGTIKGLSFASGLPVVAVPTLEAFALGQPCTGMPVVPMLDARKKEVYAGVFIREGQSIIRLRAEETVRPETLLETLKDYETVYFTGQGAELYRELIVQTLKDRAAFALPKDMVPSPASVAHIGLQQAERGAFSDPAAISPFYIRKSEAELKKQ